MIDTKPQNQDLREHQQDNAKKYVLQRIIQTAENQKQRENIGGKKKEENILLNREVRIRITEVTFSSEPWKKEERKVEYLKC